MLDLLQKKTEEACTFPSLEYRLVNKIMTPSRILQMPPEFEESRRLLVETMFKTTPVSLMSGELLNAIKALETNAGFGCCHFQLPPPSAPPPTQLNLR